MSPRMTGGFPAQFLSGGSSAEALSAPRRIISAIVRFNAPLAGSHHVNASTMRGSKIERATGRECSAHFVLHFLVLEQAHLGQSFGRQVVPDKKATARSA